MRKVLIKHRKRFFARDRCKLGKAIFSSKRTALILGWASYVYGYKKWRAIKMELFNDPSIQVCPRHSFRHRQVSWRCCLYNKRSMFYPIQVVILRPFARLRKFRFIKEGRARTIYKLSLSSFRFGLSKVAFEMILLFIYHFSFLQFLFSSKDKRGAKFTKYSFAEPDGRSLLSHQNNLREKQSERISFLEIAETAWKERISMSIASSILFHFISEYLMLYYI